MPDIIEVLDIQGPDNQGSTAARGLDVPPMIIIVFILGSSSSGVWLYVCMYRGTTHRQSICRMTGHTFLHYTKIVIILCMLLLLYCEKLASSIILSEKFNVLSGYVAMYNICMYGNFAVLVKLEVICGRRNDRL